MENKMQDINKMKESTLAWLKEMAKKNDVSVDDVLRYLDALSRGGKVVYHLDLH